MQSKLSKLQKEILIAVYNNHDSIDTSTLLSTFKSYNSANRAMHALVERRLLTYHRKRKYAKEILLTEDGKETAEELLLVDTAGFLIQGEDFKAMLLDITEIKDYRETLIIIEDDVLVFIGIIDKHCNGELEFGNIYPFYIEEHCRGKASLLVKTKILRKYSSLITKGKKNTYNYFLEIRGTRLIIHEGDRHTSNYFCEFEGPDNPPSKEKTPKKKTKKANREEKEYEPTDDDWKLLPKKRKVRDYKPTADDWKV